MSTLDTRVSTPPRASSGRQWRALSGLMTRQMYRDPMTVFFSVAFPLLLAGFLIVMMQITWVRGPYTITAPQDPSAASTMVKAIGDGSTVAEAGSKSATVLDVDQAERTVRLVVDPEKPSVVAAVRSALGDTPWAGYEVVAVDPQGGTPFDPMTLIVPGAITFALLSLALTGTASALVAMRASGSLRLLSTTPARRPSVLLSLLPGRAALAAGTLAVLTVGVMLIQDLPPLNAARLLLTSTLGLAMLLALGYLLGGRLRSPELTNAIASLASPLLLMGTGLLFPLDLMPDWLATPLSYTPLALFGDALRHDVPGTATDHSIWLDWGVVALTAVALTALATRTFRWDTETRS